MIERLIEDTAGLDAIDLDRLDRVKFATGAARNLEEAARLARAILPADWFVYQGGRHVAIHRTQENPRRVLLLSEVLDWSFHGIACHKWQADQWRADLEQGHCPFCARAIRPVHRNQGRHLQACPRRPVNPA